MLFKTHDHKDQLERWEKIYEPQDHDEVQVGDVGDEIL
jgi:hypothetical protein